MVFSPSVVSKKILKFFEIFGHYFLDMCTWGAGYFGYFPTLGVVGRGAWYYILLDNG